MMESFRIVSLCPSNTELLAALELEHLLVGVDNYSDYPDTALRGLPRLGPDLNIDIKAVQSLQPDLVISSLSVPGMEKVVEGIEAAGLSQLVLSPHSLEEIYEDLRLVAKTVPENILPRGRAEQVIASLNTRVGKIRDWTHAASPPKLYWEWWPSPVFSPGGRNWLTELSRLAGAVNIFEGEDVDAVQDDGVRTTSANPDWFLAVWTGVPQHKVPLEKLLRRDELWQQTTALRKRQLYVLSEGLFCRPSPRLVDGLEQLVGLLYPKAIEELHLRRPAEYGPVRLADGSWLDMPAADKR